MTAPSWMARAIVRAMLERGYRVDTGPGEANIVYVEGMDVDGAVNGDAPNKFNDLRCVIQFVGSEPKIVGIWEATTEPGKYWTENRMNAAGAARIAFGQYTAWRVGIHNGSHEGLVQRADVSVHRDDNEDMIRTGDTIDTGLFGINQHWGYDLPKDDLGQSSAGCLVGRTTAGHREFMALVKSDPRYVADHNFMFTTTILKESDVVAASGQVTAPLPVSSVPHAAEYADQWRRMAILPGYTAAVDALARKLIASKSRYQGVSAQTGVPWYFIAIIHERESSASFQGNLHNGQPLGQVTTLVPAGRGPFATWEASAVDALKLKGLERIRDWPLERIAYECERYNGMGYRNKGVPSAYLWSFSNIYQGGKYVADGVWSSTATDKQCGTMPLLKAMMQIDASISFVSVDPVITPPPPTGQPAMPPDGPAPFNPRVEECLQELRPVLEKYMAASPAQMTPDELRAWLISALTGMKAPAAALPSPEPVEPTVPAPPVTEPATPALQKPSVQLSMLGLAAATLAQMFGLIGTPVGEAATNAGAVATIAPILTGIVGATGAFGPAGIIGGLLGVGGKWLAGQLQQPKK